MKSNKQYAHLHIYRTVNQSSAHVGWILSDKTVDTALMFVSLAGLLSAITFLMTMW